MSDLCIIYNNAVDYATISASSTEGTTSANNLKNDIKGKIHRSTTNTVTYTFTWDSDQTIGAIAFPATNLPADATVNVSLSDSGPTELYSILDITPFTYTDIDNGFGNGYTGTATANHFIMGRLTSGYIIFNSVYTTVRTMVVTITRTIGTIDVSRIMAGNVWRSERYASNGIKFEPLDDSKVTKLTSGSVVFDKSYRSSTLSFDIKYMAEVDRAILLTILRIVGNSTNIFLTIFPSFEDRLHQDYSIYGRITGSPITYEVYNFYSYTVNMESW